MIGTLAGLRAYAAARGNQAPTTASDADATAALVRGSDHITIDYVARFAPGYDATSPNVEAAAYEAAILELAKPGLFARVYTPGERKVLTAVASLRWEVLPGQDGGTVPVSTRVEALLRPYLVLGLAFAVV